MLFVTTTFKYNLHLGYNNHYIGYYMSLLTFLKANPDARRIFGQRELKIIEKQLLGINLTQSEKNRLSRDIRRKFAFIKEVGRFGDEFALKKGAIVQTLIRNGVDAIRQDKFFPRIERIVLFGSTMTRERTFRSDIDIAVVFPDITLKEATEFRIRVLGYLPETMDIQVYNHLPEKIQKEIDKTGRMLYERENL